MSDASVVEALRSSVHRVVVEAPAGTGKTHQAVSYARHAASELRKGQRVLILAHTHAACDVFSSRTADLGAKLQIGTIDSLVAMVAKVYHRALDLPPDIPAWSIDRGPDCYTALARRVRLLLDRSAALTGALAERYPVIVCDEHQDASNDQQGIVDALSRAGARLRFFGDPMQAIFAAGVEREALQFQWRRLVDEADSFERLDTAHRWNNGSPGLGTWVLEQRECLSAEGLVDLRGRLPQGLHVLRGDNQAQRYGAFQLDSASRKPIDSLVRSSPNLLILTPHTATVLGLNAFFGWRIRIWEGYTRDALNDLLASCRRATGDPVALGKATCTFLEAVGKGFSATAYGNRLIEELKTKCAKPSRGKPAEIQSIARLILENPDHVGVGAGLELIHQLMQTSTNFRGIRIDLGREFAEARQIRTEPDINTVLTKLTHQRGVRKGQLPPQAISTIHKSKGLETRRALLVPCDANNLVANEKNRCLLYVALSRACEHLTLVVPRSNPSPLLKL